MVLLNDHDIERIIEPWTVARFRTSDAAWRAIYEDELRFMTKKDRQRRLRSLSSFFTGSFRNVEFVRKQYNRTWGKRSFPDVNGRAVGEKLDQFEWGEHGFTLRLGGSHAMFIEAVARAIDHLRPERVLEVGCGMGSNLFVLANLFPDVRFDGIELTEAGVRRAREQQTQTFPEGLSGLSLRPMATTERYRSIAFTQGDASAMSFPDRAFDLVYTVLAVEQMQAVRDAALQEIVRVASSHVMLIEPFLDSNRDPLRELSKRAKDHVRLGVDDLGRYGLTVEAHYNAWPQKLTEGVDKVLARVA